MDEKLESQLAERFSFMNRNKGMNGDRIVNLYEAFGCECGDGWYNLIYELCEKIEEAYHKRNLKPDLNVLQVKEKFGELRFYFNTPSNTPDELFGEVYDLVEAYSRKSTSICEICGKLGMLRNKGGWIGTLCDNHNYCPM